MKLSTQLWVMVAAAAGAVGVPAASLWLLSRDVRAVHTEFIESQAELGVKLALANATEVYFREQMDRVAQGESASTEPAERAQVLALYTRIDQLIIAANDGQEGVAEMRRLDRLRQNFLTLADALKPLSPTQTDLVSAVDRRFDTELLPALFESAGYESAALAENTANLDQRATWARSAAAVSLFAGLLLLLALVRLLIRRTQTALAELLTTTRAFAGGALDQRVGPLPVDELDEIGRAFNRMAAALKDASDARVRSEKLAAVGQLAASVGHEIRNPLSAARNALTYVRRKYAKGPAPAAGDRTLEFVELADRELGACNRIVQDLLDFARERPLTMSASALSPLVKEVLQVVRRRADVRVENAIPEDLPPVDADRDQLRQVLLNLVQNGVEAIPEARPGVVSVKAQVQGERLRISVADDGTGIPESDRQRIFEPLVTTKTKGTGLGLAITSQIIKRHGGTLELETELGRGTAFHITLPLHTERSAP